MANKADTFQDEYKGLTQDATRLKDEVLRQLDRIVKHTNAVLGFPIQSRVKEWSSVKPKMERPPQGVSKVVDLQDVIGFRIVLVFLRDVVPVVDAVKGTVDVIRTYDKLDRLKSDQFGYQSVHIVARLPSAWTSAPTMQGLEKFKFEVQVRTLAQHLWAEASKKLQYKQSGDVPKDVQRSINRVSALLETVDLEYERVLKDREQYRKAVKDSAEEGASDNLNVDLLEQILDDLLPALNKDAEGEDYARLLSLLQAEHITTAGQLRSLIHRHIEQFMALDADRANEEHENIQQGFWQGPEYSDPDKVACGAFFTHVGLVSKALSMEPQRKKHE
jgi:GTP pyrophosphokinase